MRKSCVQEDCHGGGLSYTARAMTPVLRAFILTTSIALLTGCGKKAADASKDAERPPATEEQLPTPAAPPGVAATDAPIIPGLPTDAPVAAAPDENKTNADFEAWFKKFGLDLSDPGMLDADTDGDGFSNRDEFLADSSPKDAESRPGISKSIRLKEYNEVRLPFVVRAVEGEAATVEFADGASPKEKVKKGDTIRGTKLKVDRVENRIDKDKHGDRVDMSSVVMTDSETNERVVALKDLPTRTNATFATLIGADGKTTLKVREGETFAWPDEPGTSYKVIDLRPEQVIVKDEASGKTITIVRQ
jgi:hypothetical protein